MRHGYRQLSSEPSYRWVDFPPVPSTESHFLVCWPLFGTAPDAVARTRRAIEVSLQVLLPREAACEVRDDAVHGLGLYLPKSQSEYGYRVAGICARVVGKVRLCCNRPVDLRASWFSDELLQALTLRAIERAIAAYIRDVAECVGQNYKYAPYKELAANAAPFMRKGSWYGSRGHAATEALRDASQSYRIGKAGF